MSNLYGGLTFVSGALLTSAGPATVKIGGIGIAATGAVVVSTLLPSPLFYVNGVPVDVNGTMFMVDKASAVAPLISQGGLQYDSSGAVVTVAVGSATAPLVSSSKLTFDASGALVITT